MPGNVWLFVNPVAQAQWSTKRDVQHHQFTALMPLVPGQLRAHLGQAKAMNAGELLGEAPATWVITLYML